MTETEILKSRPLTRDIKRRIRAIRDEELPNPPRWTQTMRAYMTRPGRPKKEITKGVVSFRIDGDILNALKRQPKYTQQVNALVRGWLTGIGAL
jgi:uncharacterized protein (DUF4415 family)